MKKPPIAIAILLPLLALLLFAGFDCYGPESQCELPSGLSYGDRYCQRGERGSCGKDETQTRYWVAEPCLEGSVCTMQEGRALCLRPDGSEAPEPEAVCETEGQSECDEKGFRRCELASSGDLLWSSRQACNGVCQEGVCLQACASAELGHSSCRLDAGVASCTQVGESTFWLEQTCGENERCYDALALRELSCGLDTECAAACAELDCVDTCYADPVCARNWDLDQDACAPDPWTAP